MLKRILKKWLGVIDLQDLVYDLVEALENKQDEYDRLKNMYHSNRVRVDNATQRIQELNDMVRAFTSGKCATIVKTKPKKEIK